MREKRYEEACSAFEASEALEHAAGTLVNWGVCLEAQGKTASAWRVFRESLALGQARPDEARERFARERLARLGPLVCRMRLVPTSANPPDTIVMLDESELDAGAAGGPILLDPGEHTLEVAAPGRQAWLRTFSSSDDDCMNVMQVPALAPEAPHLALGAATPAGPPRSLAHDRRSGGDALRRTGLTLAVGLFAGGVVGTTYFGLRARAAWSERQAHCPAHRCDADAVARSDDATRFAHAADISVAVAGAALGAGVYFALFAHGPRAAEPAHLAISPAPRGARIDWGTAF